MGHGAWGKKSEIGGQKSEIRGKKVTRHRGKRPEVGSQRSEDRRQLAGSSGQFWVNGKR